MMKRIYWMLVCAGAQGIAVAAPAAANAGLAMMTEKTGVSADLAPLVGPHSAPGIVAVVLSGDRVVAAGVAGVRRAGSPEPVTLNDQFHLGSDTKAMTATLAAILIEEGRLKWDTTLGEVFPDLPQLHPDWKAVTLKQLLTHRASVPPRRPAEFMAQLRQETTLSLPQQRALVVARVVAQPPARPPGMSYEYSNTGYVIVGAMMEKVTGEAWEKLMQERLFRPLGITSAGFGPPGTPDKNDEPRGHDAAGAPIEPGPSADNPAALGPAGTVHLAIEDWAKFIALHLRGDPRNPQTKPRLLKAESFAELHTPVAGPGEKYACGWLVAKRTWAKGTRAEDTSVTLTHGGSNTFWYCVVWIAPEKDWAVLVACNRGGDGASRACDAACVALMKKYLPQGLAGSTAVKE